LGALEKALGALGGKVMGALEKALVVKVTDFRRQLFQM
jgi:hypothetical protein